jgi:apolipoprotein D and lipocalin family protein
MKRHLIGGIVSSIAAALTGCATTSDIAAVRNFEPERYMGTWYEIARLPQYFERDLDEVRARYTLQPDGTIKVVNSGVKDGEAKSITGTAKLKRPKEDPLTGELRVSFFWPFYSDYRIIELDPDYSVAVVTAGSRGYLWVLSRKPEMAKEELDAIVSRMKTLGFEVDKLEYPKPAKPDQET